MNFRKHTSYAADTQVGVFNTGRTGVVNGVKARCARIVNLLHREENLGMCDMARLLGPTFNKEDVAYAVYRLEKEGIVCRSTTVRSIWNLVPNGKRVWQQLEKNFVCVQQRERLTRMYAR